MIINVTKDDIKNGFKSVPSACPIARAIKRSIPDHTAYVKWSCVEILNKNKELVGDVSTTVRMKQFIERFDKGLKVKPTKFRIGFTINGNKKRTK